jgi:hypothetical protein
LQLIAERTSTIETIWPAAKVRRPGLSMLQTLRGVGARSTSLHGTGSQRPHRRLGLGDGVDDAQLGTPNAGSGHLVRSLAESSASAF